MNKLSIVGIRVDNRGDHATRVQDVLTSHGTKIVGRFGVPTPDKRDGLITVIMDAEDDDVQHLTNKLSQISGVAVDSISL